MRTRHPDDFALLRYTAGDLDESERGPIVRHLDHCDACLLTLAEIRPLDRALRRIGSAERTIAGDADPDAPFAADDPFGERPDPGGTRPNRFPPELLDVAIAASDRARAEVEGFLEAAGDPQALPELLDGLALRKPEARYLLLYALEEAGRRMTVDGPTRPLRLAEETLRRLERESPDGGPAEAMIRLGTITGQARVLAGQAGNWNGSLERAGEHLEAAYRAFAASGDLDGIRLALTEFHESQRRSFAGRAGEGLALARRSRSTFEELGLEDYAVRARVAEGIALSVLDRDEEALLCFQRALPVFEREGLWTNYVSALNSLGASLARLGRLDEARREYSRALRRLSRERHVSILPFIRHGLAIVLVSAGRHRDAASSFHQAARLFGGLGLVGDALTASLWEIESWARSGDADRALHRLEIFRSSIARPEALEALDPFIVGQLEEALLGRAVDFERLGQLRQEAQKRIREKLRVRAS